MNHRSYLIVANHTASGKTLVSGLLCYRFHLAYFKPIESGSPQDSAQIKAWFPGIQVYESLLSFREEEPPHILQHRYRKNLRVSHILKKLPKENIILETAGGWYSPLNEEETMADLATSLGFPLILVIRPYLGAINHTLLTLRAIFETRLTIEGYILNGEDIYGLEKFILSKYPFLKCIAKIPELKSMDAEKLKELAKKLWP